MQMIRSMLTYLTKGLVSSRLLLSLKKKATLKLSFENMFPQNQLMMTVGLKACFQNLKVSSSSYNLFV